MLSDDFDDSSSGWPDGEGCNYQAGVYRIFPSDTFLFHGASPDWGIPSDTTIRTEAWSDSDQGAFGLVFGIKELCWDGEIHWESWYAFVIEPASQTYWLEYWSAFGADHVTVKYGMSPAIIADAGAHQSLEVHRSGDETRLIVNGVEVDTYTAAPFTDKRSAGVAIMTTFPTMHPMPTGFFDNFQVSASGCITLPPALCD